MQGAFVIASIVFSCAVFCAHCSPWEMAPGTKRSKSPLPDGVPANWSAWKLNEKEKALRDAWIISSF